MSALHELEATPATVHRGCFGPSLAPVLTVRSGDLVHPGPREGARDDLLVPGITAILTPGHTPATRASSSSARTAAAGCSRSMRLKAIAAERGLPLVPGHDPDAWPALTAELAAS